MGSCIEYMFLRQIILGNRHIRLHNIPVGSLSPRRQPHVQFSSIHVIIYDFSCRLTHDISSKDLQNINNRAPMEQAYNKAVSPIHVRYLYVRCPVYVRYKSGQVPNKCRTYSGQRREMHRRYAGATIWIEWRYA